MKPALGTPAPDMSLTAVGGEFTEPRTIKLADYDGQPVVLYFYPKDATPG